MSGFKKMKEQILQPKCKNDFKPDEIKSFLKKFGFICVHVNGSHHIYKFIGKKKNYMLNVVMHKVLDPANIFNIRERILEIEEEEND